MRFAFPIVLLTVAAVNFSAVAQTIRPATRPTAPASRPAAASPASQPAGNAAEILTQAAAELKAGKFAQAQKLATDGVNSYGKTVPLKLEDPVRINLYQVLAVSHMRLNETPKARLAMDKVRTSSMTNRAVRINDAMLDAQIKSNWPRAADTLLKLLKDGPVEEALVDAYGYVISKLESDRATQLRAEKMWTDYQSFEIRLTPPTPGLQRWGSEWNTAQQMDSVESQKRQLASQREDLKRAMDYKESELNKAKERLLSADASYQAARKRNAQTADGSSVNSANARVRTLQIEFDKAKAEYEAAPVAPKPVFAAPSFKGVDPDLELVLK